MVIERNPGPASCDPSSSVNDVDERKNFRVADNKFDEEGICNGDGSWLPGPSADPPCRVIDTGGAPSYSTSTVTVLKSNIEWTGKSLGTAHGPTHNGVPVKFSMLKPVVPAP
jgi:hypothetical protein